MRQEAASALIERRRMLDGNDTPAASDVQSDGLDSYDSAAFGGTWRCGLCTLEYVPSLRPSFDPYYGVHHAGSMRHIGLSLLRYLPRNHTDRALCEACGIRRGGLSRLLSGSG